MHAYHGVMPQERVVGNDYVVNIRIGYPIEKACETDDINDTLNYAKVAELVKETMSTPSNLLEHVAGRVINSIRQNFPLVENVRISIKKVAPPFSVNVDSAGVELTWNCK